MGYLFGAILGLVLYGILCIICWRMPRDAWEREQRRKRRAWQPRIGRDLINVWLDRRTLKREMRRAYKQMMKAALLTPTFADESGSDWEGPI